MQYPEYQDINQDIVLIDSGMVRPGLAACYLLTSGDEAVFVETGTTHTVPSMLRALESRDMAPEQVRFVIPTHVHLDHAGGAGALMQQCPHAELAIHPRGAPHMIDPSRLYAGATEVYGEATMKKLYGDVVPVAEDRVRVMEDGDVLSFGDGRALLFLDTPGHARHHHCIYDEQNQGFFTGDTFGLSYRDFDTERGAYVLPTTTPVQFDPEAWLLSIDRLLSYEPQVMYLTHYGKLEDVAEQGGHLKREIRRYADLARELGEQHGPGEERHQALKHALFDHTLAALRQHGCRQSEEEIHNLLDMDMKLNAQGLEVWLDRHAARRDD